MSHPISESVPCHQPSSYLKALTIPTGFEEVPVQLTYQVGRPKLQEGDVSVTQGPCRYRQFPLKLLEPSLLQLLAREVAAMLHQVVLSHPVAE